MVSMKRSIAALIVCFKPHVLLTLCILLVIAHSIAITVQRGGASSWRFGRQHELTLTMTSLVLAVALIWAAFFIFIVRFELRNELESLLILFQCSKRGLRFMGVVGFHVGLLVFVALMVSATVERSIPPAETQGLQNVSLSDDQQYEGGASGPRRYSPFSRQPSKLTARHSATIEVIYEADDEADELVPLDVSGRKRELAANSNRLRVRPVPPVGHRQFEARKSKTDREYLLTVYKIWLTAIVYAFSYLVIENVIMFYADMSLIEFVHDSFLSLVAKLTGIDLSDYPAGEMLFNPLVRNRIR